MSQQPLDYQRGDLPDTATAVRQFRWTVLVIAFVLNAALLLASLNDVFPRGRPGMHNFLAMMIAVFISPILNGLLLVIGLGVGAAMRSRYQNRLRDFAVVAVWAPIVGALVNFLVVLMIVPWRGNMFEGVH